MINKIFGFCDKYNTIPEIIEPVKRIVAIGDVHGDFDYLIHLLKIALVIDNEYHWIGGSTHVVQLGDQIDSCRPYYNNCQDESATQNDKAEDIKIINFLGELHNDAVKKNGAVISLLGNHEIMNIAGDMNYVSKKNLDDVGGIEKRRKLFAKDGEIGKKLICTHPSVIIIGSNLFVHAGILPQLTENIPKIRETYKNAIIEYIKSMKDKDVVNLLINYVIHKNIKKEILISIDKKDKDFWDTTFDNDNKIKHIADLIKKNSTILRNLLENADKIKDYFVNNSDILNIDNIHDVEIINDVVRLWLFDKINDTEVMDSIKSLFWNRILGNLPNDKHKNQEPITCKSFVDPILHFFNINHMIIGHTPQYIANQSGINYSCDATVAKVDIGGSNAFDAFDSEYVKTGKKMKNRTPQVLVIDDDKNFRVLYYETPTITGGKFLNFFKNFYFI